MPTFGETARRIVGHDARVGMPYESYDTGHIVNLLEANMYAQLEVAEQLRIGNLLTLLNAGPLLSEHLAVKEALYIPDSGDTFRPEIADALGIVYGNNNQEEED